MPTLSCPTCLYTAHHDGDADPVVVQAGGSRRPRVDPALASWRLLLAARRGDGPPVVGPCPKCELPLLTDGQAGETPPFTLTTPLGSFVVASDVTHPDGTVLSDAAADEILEDLLRKRIVVEPAAFVYQSIIMTMGLVPILVWMVATCFALWMFIQMAQGNLYQ